MKSRKDDAVFLRHIREAIQRIESYTADGRKAFMGRPMVQDAVVRNLEIIGEAVRNLSTDLKERHRRIPWRSITALRNLLSTNTSGSTSRSSGGSCDAVCRP